MDTTSPIVRDPTRSASARDVGSIAARAVPLIALVIVIVLILDVVLVVAREANRYFAYAPGTAPVVTASPGCKAASSGALALANGTPCVRLVVPADKAHEINGTLMMVDVLVGKATPWDWLLSRVGLLGTFEQGVQLVPAGAVLGSTPPSQLACQDTQAMNDSTLSASVVALTRLGYDVHEKNLGATITQVEPGSAAAAAGLECNDTVTAVDATPVHTSTDLVSYIQHTHPGQRVVVTVNRTLASGSTVVKHLDATVGSRIVVVNKKEEREPFLGVATMTDVTFVFPFDLSVDVGAIGGPSAGLALTLGLLDVLSDGDLTGGHRVAATGTIGLDGSVGDVGGVAQKTVAVRRAGAQIFLVPPQELAVAKSEAGSMKVFAVSTLDQAISDLESLGGRLPTPTGKNGAG